MASQIHSLPFRIVDTHIHLYASSHISTLNWTADLSVDHALNRQNSVVDYRSATSPCPGSLLGFIFIETDRKSGLAEHEWDHVLDEVSFLARIAWGTPLSGDGFIPDDKGLVLGIVPWAPMPAGPAVLSRYLTLARDRCAGEAGEVWEKVKGVRYLVQDKPAGVMLEPDFIQGLKWLGENDFSFDLGVDARSGGLHQLREACEMLRRVHEAEGGPNLTVIINHLCKPNLRLTAPEALGGHPDFVEWTARVQEMAGFTGTFMKLSGAFGELPPRESGKPADIEELVLHTKPWMDVVFKAFGPSRIMFGSDWPVCNANGPGMPLGGRHWHAFVTAILTAQKLSDGEKMMVWSGTGAKAYKIY